MSCDKYRQHELGEISPEEFSEHVETCRDCSEALRFDAQIESEAIGIPALKSAPGLWYKIAADLEKDQARERLSWHGFFNRLIQLFNPQQHLVLKVAAVLVVAIGLTAIFYPRPHHSPARNLLTEQALDRAEALEEEYEKAIKELEILAEPLIAEIDTELRLHYRKRLETIDTQIRRCRIALKTDCGNAHIRHYLLTAYQDKRKTITDLIKLSEQPM